jgi:hypothetical protein
MGRKVVSISDEDERYATNLKPYMETNRKCRDVPCLILFIVFWIGMAIVAVNAMKQGDPRRLV